MRRVFVLLGACLVMSLMLAPSAMAQGGAGPEGEGPCTGTFEQYIPEVNGCVLTEGSPNPGQSTVFDADTGEPIGTLDEVNAQIEAGEAPDSEDPELGNSRAAAYDPANYDRSEINPDGPCFDPQIAPTVDGVPVEDLALAYVNRNDPVGTPLVSPLDSDNDGIACNALTRAEAKAISDGGTSGNDQYGDSTDDTQQPAETSANEQYAEDTGDTAEISVLPDTGGLPLWSIGAGAGLLLTAGGLLLKRRLS